MIRLVCVGKLRERHWAEAAAEYLKRLERLMPVSVAEVRDEPEPARPSPALNEAVLRAEGERILSRITPGEHVVALCIDGQPLSSEQLADKLRRLLLSGQSRVTFVIGGSLGLGAEVLERANERVSMSAMTFPHQLARVMLLEQIYRAAKLNAGERYHK